MHRPNMYDNTIVDILTPEINMSTKKDEECNRAKRCGKELVTF